MLILQSHDIMQERIILPEISDNNNRLNCFDYITLYTLELLRYNKIYTRTEKSRILEREIKAIGNSSIKFINGGRK